MRKREREGVRKREREREREREIGVCVSDLILVHNIFGQHTFYQILVQNNKSKKLF